MSLWPSAGVFAATVYRWVDEQGKVNYAELVPERYRAVAKPVGAPANDPTAEEQAQALDRARKDKARAAAAGADRALPVGATTAASDASPAAVKRPEQMPNDQTDCETWQSLYLESMACFGPYRTVRGGYKVEAYALCKEVPEPPPYRCLPRIP